MRAGYDLPPLMFTRDEIVALVVGARMVRAWGGATMASAAEEALVKIDAVLPDAERDRARRVQVHAFATFDMSIELRTRIDALESAVDRRQRVECDYQDKGGVATSRVVRPLALLFWGNVWTLATWCEMREDFRMFRIDRVLNSQEAGTFRPERGKTIADFYAKEARRRGGDFVADG